MEVAQLEGGVRVLYVCWWGEGDVVIVTVQQYTQLNNSSDCIFQATISTNEQPIAGTYRYHCSDKLHPSMECSSTRLQPLIGSFTGYYSSNILHQEFDYTHWHVHTTDKCGLRGTGQYVYPCVSINLHWHNHSNKHATSLSHLLGMLRVEPVQGSLTLLHLPLPFLQLPS